MDTTEKLFFAQEKSPPGYGPRVYMSRDNLDPELYSQLKTLSTWGDFDKIGPRYVSFEFPNETRLNMAVRLLVHHKYERLAAPNGPISNEEDRRRNDRLFAFLTD